MSPPPKILIIRFSSIGDIVLTTPVIRCVKQQLGAEVHFLTKKPFHAILKANPYLDRIHLIDKKVGEVLPTLKTQGFDYILDLHNNLRSRQVKMALRAKAYTFNKLNWQKWLIVNFKIDRLPRVHIVDRYLATTRLLGVVNDQRGLDYFIPPSDEVSLHAFFQQHGLQMDPYIAFVVGAAHQTKRLPTEKIISICRQIKPRVILIGGPEEREEGDLIAREAGPHVLNTCGRLGLNQSASLVRQAEVVIAHDTGFMHIAAAFQRRIVSIWGNTIPEFGMYPYYQQDMDLNTTVEVKGLACRPCSKIGHQSCPQGHFKCMNLIKEKEIGDGVTKGL